MEYTPKQIERLGLGEVPPEGLPTLTHTAIVRRLRISGFDTQGETLNLRVETPPATLAIPSGSVMTFGTESVAARPYLKRVVEKGDMIDVVVDPQAHGVFPISCYWIHIEYLGSPSEAGNFKRKDDGLFAMRAKAGEKAERIVARHLRDSLGHSFPDEMCESPGFFEIRYAGKRRRGPDRRCTACGLTFEVKKRNNDEKFRISHSSARPFASENAPDAWHAFVFADMRPRFVKNTDIIQAIESGQFQSRSYTSRNKQEVDEWADIEPDAVTLSEPPRCTGS